MLYPSHDLCMSLLISLLQVLLFSHCFFLVHYFVVVQRPPCYFLKHSSCFVSSWADWPSLPASSPTPTSPTWSPASTTTASSLKRPLLLHLLLRLLKSCFFFFFFVSALFFGPSLNFTKFLAKFAMISPERNFAKYFRLRPKFLDSVSLKP